MSKYRKIVLIPVVLLILAGVWVYIINSNKMTIIINDTPTVVKKDLILVNDDVENIYVDIQQMLKVQNIPFHVNEYGITALLRGSKVIRFDPDKNTVVVNGNSLQLDQEDYIYKKKKLYLSERIYKKLFDQVILAGSKEDIKFFAYDVGAYKIPQDLTFGQYLAMSSKERAELINKNPYSEKILQLKANIIPGEDLTPVVRDAYYDVGFSFDLYTQYQFYNWHLGLDDSSNLTGYIMCSNAQTILGQFEEMKILKEVAKLEEFTSEDIKYINRINTIYRAFDFDQVKKLKSAIIAYKNRLDPNDSDLDVYRRAAEKALNQFEKTFEIEKVDILPIPSWAEFDSYYPRLKYAIYEKKEKSLIESLQEMLDFIPQDVQDTIDWIQKYNEIEEIILAAHPEFEDYLLSQTAKEGLYELVENLKKGKLKNVVDITDTAFGKIKIADLYDNINLLKDALNLISTEKDNDFFAELKKSKVESASNILNTMINPANMIKAGLELGNANLVCMGGILSVELFVAQEVMSHIEKLGKFVSGMILMSLNTDSILDVYEGRITLDEYLDGE